MRGGKAKNKSLSKSQRAGLTFPVARIRRLLKPKLIKHRIASGAPVYLAAILEYLTGILIHAKKFVFQTKNMTSLRNFWY